MTDFRLKRLLLIFALLFGVAVASTAQMSMSGALDSLEKLQLVTPREKGLVLQRYADFDKRRSGNIAGGGEQERDYSRRDELLGLVVQAKMFSSSGNSSDLTFTPAPTSSRRLPAAAIRAELDGFIRALDKAGLVSAFTLRELLRDNGDDKFGWKVQVAAAAYVGANEEYFLRPEKLKRFVDRLHDEKVISDSNYGRLLLRSAHGELHRYSELPAYLNFCLTIPLKGLPTDSLGFLHALYAATSKVMPGLQYDTIGFRLKKDERESEPDFQVYNLITTISRGGRSFSYSGFYNADYKSKGRRERPIPEGFHSVFNKILADQSSPYRLHTFPVDSNTIGVIALTEPQFKQFNRTYDGAIRSYLQVGYEKYTGGLTQGAIRSAIKSYDSLGLFAHLTTAEKDSCMEEVNTREIIYYSDILKCYKNLVLDIDEKYGIDSGQYARITSSAALISKGRFHPSSIIDGYTYEHPKFTYGFTVGNKVYSAVLHQDGKYLDPDFWSLIDSAMKENDPQGAFHYVFPSDGFTEIYLTNVQYAFLLEHRLLEFSDPEADR